MNIVIQKKLIWDVLGYEEVIVTGSFSHHVLQKPMSLSPFEKSVKFVLFPDRINKFSHIIICANLLEVVPVCQYSCGKSSGNWFFGHKIIIWVRLMGWTWVCIFSEYLLLLTYLLCYNSFRLSFVRSLKGYGLIIAKTTLTFLTRATHIFLLI